MGMSGVGLIRSQVVKKTRKEMQLEVSCMVGMIHEYDKVRPHNLQIMHA